jgi:NAD(P)-dependent dehydrogenase (short-subunit alcohol dehydrogenase family)
MPQRLFDLTGKRALVTGGGTGIGRALVMALAEAGAGIVICGRRPEPLEATAAQARRDGREVQVIPSDVTREADVQRLRGRAGDIDILVNNAGGAQRKPWRDVTSEQWRDVIGLNLDAAFRLCQLFAPAMVERGWGRVINIASVYGISVMDPARYPGMEGDNASYTAAKHGLIGITRHFAAQLGRTGVTSNAISPGMILVEKLAGMLSREALEALAAGTPLGRLGTPEDLQTAVLFLASPASGFVTGQNIVVDGGWTIW